MKAVLKIQPVEWPIVESTPKGEMHLTPGEDEHFYRDGMGKQKTGLPAQVRFITSAFLASNSSWVRMPASSRSIR